MGFCEGDSFGGEQDSVTGFCEQGSEHSGCINGRKCHDQLIDFQLFKKGCAEWSWIVTLNGESCFLHGHSVYFRVVISSDNCRRPLRGSSFNVST